MAELQDFGKSKAVMITKRMFFLLTSRPGSCIISPAIQVAYGPRKGLNLPVSSYISPPTFLPVKRGRRAHTEVRCDHD